MIKNIIHTLNWDSDEVTTIFTADEDSRIGSLVAEINITSLNPRTFLSPTLEESEEQIRTRYFYDEFLKSHIRMELVLSKENEWHTISSYAAINRAAPYRFPLNSIITDSNGFLWIEKNRALGIRLVDVSYGLLNLADKIHIFGHAIIGRDDFTVVRTLEPGFLGHQWLTIASSNTALSRNAIDGDPNTYWQTASNGVIGDTFDINLGVPRTLSRIVVEPKPEAEIEVYISPNGWIWDKVNSSWIDTEPYHFALGMMATQFIRLRLNNNLSFPWQISNFQIF